MSNNPKKNKNQSGKSLEIQRRASGSTGNSKNRRKNSKANQPKNATVPESNGQAQIRAQKQIAAKNKKQSIRPRIKLHFLGSAGEVSGSLILVEVPRAGKTIRFLLEAGMHQDNESINSSRRLPRGISAADIDFVVISHAHIDHSGYLPKLINDGFKGPVYTHSATKDLLRFLLPDSGHLQESRAQRDSKQSGRKIKPAYTQKDARRALDSIKCWSYGKTYQVGHGISFKLTEASHILGAAVVTATISGGKGKGKSKTSICFTGNIGRNGMPYLRNLEAVAEADYIISESTYGNKLHAERDRLEVLAGILNEAHGRAIRKHPLYGHGVIIIPAFAVGRVQSVIYDLRELMAAGRIPTMPVILDSPMAIAATRVHRKHKQLYNSDAKRLLSQGIDPFKTARYAECTKWSHSRALSGPAAEPTIIIGSSGMAAGGRVLGHLEERLPGSRNTAVFVGYQGTGALGYTLVNESPREVVIHGKVVPVRATVKYMSDYSGHADYSEMICWLKKFRKAPRRLFLVHGDKEALGEFKSHIKDSLPRWNVTIPKERQCFELD